MKFAILILLFCFSTQALARPVPDDLFQEFLESIKSRFNKALNQVQELANRALESIKGSLLNGFDKAQNATKESLDVGKGLMKVGEATAKKFINNTNLMLDSESSTETVPMMNSLFNEIGLSPEMREELKKKIFN